MWKCQQIALFVYGSFVVVDLKKKKIIFDLYMAFADIKNAVRLCDTKNWNITDSICEL